MGMCLSHASPSVSPSSSSKLVLPDGKLQEFDHPIRPSYILERDSEYFICDADGMEFEGYVTALGLNEELRLGQLYFMLPRSMLKRPIRSEDLARLAVKASKALANSHAPLDLGLTVEKRGGSQTKRSGGGVACSGKRRGRGFVADLNVIVE